MYDKQIVTAAMRRVSAARARLVQRHPFFGRLLLRLRYRFAPCGTACTDMENIIFDIDFLGKLSNAEVEFVLLHEVMHCVLQHCLRGKGKINLIYNIACDIVVNSFILEALGCPDFKIFGENAMHLAPEKTEGREHTAEEIYQMLLQNADIAKLAKLLIDSHDGWQDIDAQRAKDEWGKYISDTARRMNGFDSVPLGMRRYLKEVSRTPTTNWRQLLQDYIRFDRSDYDFTSPDRRYDGEAMTRVKVDENSLLRGEPAEGYAISNIRVIPTSITLAGSEEAIAPYLEEGAALFPYDPVDISGQSRTVSQLLYLNTPGNMDYISNNTVQVVVTILPEEFVKLSNNSNP